MQGWMRCLGVLGLGLVMWAPGLVVAEDVQGAVVAPEVEAVELMEALARGLERTRNCDAVAIAIRRWNEQHAPRMAVLTGEVGPESTSALSREEREALDERLETAFRTMGTAIEGCVEHSGTLEAFAQTEALLEPGTRAEPLTAEAVSWGDRCTAYFEAVERTCLDVSAETCDRLRTTAEGVRITALQQGAEVVVELEAVCEKAEQGLQVTRDAER